MSTFIRRPFLASQTDAFILSQPVINGTVHINNNGSFDVVDSLIPSSGTVDFEIRFETDEGTVDVEFTAPVTLTLSEIVDGINTAALIDSVQLLTAYAEYGVLQVRARNSGYQASELAFIRVLAADSGYIDLAPLLGFAVHPHPAATVTAGDLASASPRALTQGNRPLSSFIARGEDRTSENFNRALHSISRNLDNHQVKLTQDVAVPVILEIEELSSRFVPDATTGEIKYVDLRGIASGADFFINLPHDSSLQDISKYFAVVDSDWNEILAVKEYSGVPTTRVVRIGTVAYAPSSGVIGGSSSFNADGTVTSALSTDPSFNTYRNALGSASTKEGSVGISEIIDGATIRCPDAEFVVNQVEPGDIVTISGSTVLSPIVNDGSYVVDLVVSDTEIIVRPIDPDSTHLLNSDTGTLTVTSNGQFENSLVLWFEPRLPRVPAGGIKIILGAKNELGTVPQDFLLIPAVNSAEEVDGWVLENLHRNLNLDGAYQGQGQGNGGGFFAEVTGRPLTLHMNPTAHSPVEVLSETGGEIRAGNIFVAPNDVTFTLADVGRSIYITVGTTVYSDWRIFRLLDARTIELVAPTDEVGNSLPVGAITSFKTYSGTWKEHRAAISTVTETANAGGYHYTKMNNSSTSGLLSFAHLEHLTRSAKISDGLIRENLAVLTGTFTAGVGTSIVDNSAASVDLDDLWGVHPFLHGSGSSRVDNQHGGKTLISVISGTVSSGPYLLSETQPGQITLVNLDLTAATSLTGEFHFQILTLRAGVGVRLIGDPAEVTVAVTAHQAASPSASSITRAVGLRAGWQGKGNGVLITANDSSFAALGASVGNQHVSRGYAMYVTSYAPADGIYVAISSSDTVESRGTGLHVDADTYGNSFDDPTATGSTFSTGNSKSAGAIITQIGTDPAAVFIKKDEAASPTAENLRLTSSATVVVARATQGAEPAVTGVGSAIETVGSIWVRSAAADSTVGNALGGVFSEDVVGAGRFMYPIWGTDPNQHNGYSWEDSSTYWDVPPTLGRPGVIFPVSETLADPTASVLAVDFTKFNIAHSGILETPVISYLLPVSKYVGCIIEITEIGHPQVTKKYAIIAVSGNGASLYFALSGDEDLTPASGVSYRLHGLRWHRSYLDIADWFQIGTYNGAKELNELPLISSDPYSLESRVSSDVDHSEDNFNISATPWSPAVDGAGLGVAADYTSVSGPNSSDSSTDNQWSGSAENPFLSTQWSRATNEPRPPFYAQITARNPSSVDFGLSDIVHITAGGAPDAEYVNTFGGLIKVAADPAKARKFVQRGRRFIWKDHLRVKVKFRAAITFPALSSGTASTAATVTVALKDSAGSTIVSEIVEMPGRITNLTDIRVRSFETVLSLDLSYDRASSAMALSRQDTELNVHLSFDTHAEVDYLYIQEIVTEQETDPVYVSGHQVVSGHVMAHGFRHFNPVRGFQTVGPSEAVLLGGDDYGVNMGWPKDVAAGVEISPPTSVFSSGMQELRGGVGLIRTSGRAAIDGWRGAVVFLQTGYDPVAAAVAHAELNNGRTIYGVYNYYHIEADDFAAANAAYAALVATPSLTLFNEFLLLCVEVAEESYDRAIAGPDTSFFNDIAASARNLKDLARTAINHDSSSTVKLEEAFQNIVVDKWLRPYVDLYRLFNVGVNSASITLYNGVYDPLWYAMQANALYNDTPFSGTNPISRDTFIPCGSVGFIVPIDPPHGAMLTTLSISLSFRPSSPGHWGIYFGEPDSFYESTPLYTDVADISAWAAKEGVAVELWRFNAVDIGEDEPELARWTDHVPEYGFGERLSRTEISLAGVDSNTMFTENLIAGSWNPPGFGSSTAIKAGREWLKKTVINLQSSVVEDSALRVDRRVYTYAVVVRFNGGPRYNTIAGKYLPHGPGEVINSTADAAFDQPARFYQIRQPVLGTDLSDTASTLAFEFGKSLLNKTIYAYRDPGPRVEGEDRWAPEGVSSGADYAYPPQVKFRGARIGWVTDKAGDKGWG